MRPEDRGKNLWHTFTADMVRYAGAEIRPWSFRFLRRLVSQSYAHPGLAAVVVYRFGQWTMFTCRIPILRQLAALLYYVLYNLVRFLLQIEIPRTTTIGAGLRIDHYGGILLNSKLIAGRNLSITHAVVIGETDTGVPELRDDVTIGVRAMVIGGVVLENNVWVGAGAVVTKSFPANAIVAGVPAKLLRYRDAVDSVEERTHEES
ncbi:MAG: hypothetical protein NT023_19280 [Armatimonadetes bacterium]|nr:hypothetical protein [Armatimonadota bacterium]